MKNRQLWNLNQEAEPLSPPAAQRQGPKALSGPNQGTALPHPQELCRHVQVIDG